MDRSVRQIIRGALDVDDRRISGGAFVAVIEGVFSY